MKVASRVDFVDRSRIPGESGRAATLIDDRASPALARSIARLLANARAPLKSRSLIDVLERRAYITFRRAESRFLASVRARLFVAPPSGRAEL